MDILNIDPRVLLLQIGGFVALLIVFKLFLFKPVLEILDARRREIEDRYSDAEAHTKAAEELRSQYEQHLASIEDELRHKIADAVKEGQAMREEIISDSRARADTMIAKAQEEIRRETEIALAELKTTTADLAIRAAQKLIEENLSDQKHRSLVSRVIDELSRAPR